MFFLHPILHKQIVFWHYLLLWLIEQNIPHGIRRQIMTLTVLQLLLLRV